jgi:uncharacterized protein with GYD domain
MAVYMLQFSYTSDAWNALRRNPSDRSKVASDMIYKLGGKLLSLYYCQGEYDGVALIEAPDDTAANAMVFAAMSPGHFRTTRTTRLYTPDEIINSLKMAGEVDYRGPQGG